MNIAIIGSGISGLGAAFLLDKQHKVTIYEKNNYIGGHSRTVEVNGTPVDTGFIVFNHRNYPNLVGLFKQLDVQTEKSDMSFAASIDHGWLEYGTKDTPSIFAQRINLIRPSFWRMMLDVFRFNKAALAYMDADVTVTLGQCLNELRMGQWFRRYFLLAMGGAIWSCPIEQMLQFPARTFIRFFHNHGLLTINDQPQWYTVTGGSKEYVKKITASLKNPVRINTAIKSVEKLSNGIRVETANGEQQIYDQVIFASHADQTLKLLTNPTIKQREILGKVQYQSNHAVLHSDESFMPKNRQCWASWAYQCEGKEDKRSSISLTYWMNNLQNLKGMPLFVTLNPSRMPQAEKIHDQYMFEHPVFDHDAISAQEQLAIIQGKDNMWFCGAWTRYGFHEDGLSSAVAVAQGLGAHVPWI
ncbi:MAG: amine oxidase [Chitinophagia bacterium]|nr:amine oxidase [Chitinophagia bacterium]